MSDLGSSLTLENCDREPIHIPGSVQPHGALLAFDRQGRLSHITSNASDLLGVSLAFGELPTAGTFANQGAPQPAVLQAINDALHHRRSARSFTAWINGSEFDIVLHRQGYHLICEFERREVGADVAMFAQLAFRSLDELKRSADPAELLDLAVHAVREMTGFDRVMAYRFDHDESGEIVAEAKIDDLEPYLGRRYPASDIPAQARRLYVLNTLRLIGDVSYRPVPILAAPSETQPLDLSYSVLRSVSPIHVEYLTNMGVHGSMSVSIVVGGRLWGMIACHHLSHKVVPHPIRMATDVMAQVIAATIQSMTAQHREAAVAQAARIRSDIVQAISSGQDLVEVIRSRQDKLSSTLAADALFFCIDGTARLDAEIDHDWAEALSAWLATQDSNLVHVFECDMLPPWSESVAREDRYCGVLALRFDGPRQGWLIALRREKVLNIRWGGKPDKVIAHGPLGPRLTPRGSFEEWRETVRGKAVPWSAIQLEIAAQLMDSVARAYSDRVIELDSMRAQVWAMLGHDLRNPLQSINMANLGIERGKDPERLNLIIRHSTHRMNRLLSDVLDMSRLQHGHGLTFSMQELDLSELLHRLVDETTTAHPAMTIEVDMPESISMWGDPGRLAQLFSNLFSNARHHGSGGVSISARLEPETVVVRVSNPGKPIPEEMVATLFDPFKRASMNNLRNRTGMGLGLYIAAQVVSGHHGTLDYEPGDGIVTFVTELRLTPWQGDSNDA